MTDPRGSGADVRPARPRAEDRILGLARRALAHEPLTTAGRLAYLAIAEVAARELMRLPHVEGVYLHGSIRARAAFAPGHSDLDLYVVADLDSAARERTCGEAVATWLRSRRWLRVLKHVDVGSRDELAWMRRHGGAWSIDLDRRFRCLAGRDRLDPGTPPRDPSERRLLDLAEAVRRFTKAAPVLLDRSLGRPAEIEARGSRRLLADVVAAHLGRDRLSPLDAMLAAARASSSAERLALPQALADADGPLADLARIAAAGDLLDACARALPRVPTRTIRALPDDRRDASGRDRAGLAGMNAWVAVEGYRLGGAGIRIAVGREGLGTGELVRRLADGSIRSDDGAIPTPMSRSLLALASWLDPFPLAGHALAVLGPAAGPVVAEVDASVAGILLRARLAAAPRRARGRRLRLGTEDASAAVLHEVAIGEALADALENGSPAVAELRVPPARDVDEAIASLDARVGRLLL